MSHRGRVAITGMLAACAALGIGLPQAAAQGRGVLSGTVRDTAGQAIAGAEVGILGTPARARTDETGLFRIGDAPVGPVTLQARRIGFQMLTLSADVSSTEVSRVDIRLQALGTVLAPVVVRSRRARFTGRLAGFYERMHSGLSGYFITRDRIEEGNTRQLTNILQRVPGLEVIRGRIRMRGRPCAPLVWIDGVAMPAGEVDLNSFPPSSLEGIELYLTATAAPMRYQSTVDRGRCGTILLWSRGPDTEGRRQLRITSPEHFDRRVAGGELYTARDVDIPAEPDSTTLRVTYPPELLADGVGGSVLAEVVVDSTGRAEVGTFGIVHSSHPLFSRAVQEALRETAFRPALRGGRQVSQLVHIPVHFDPPGGEHRRKRG